MGKTHRKIRQIQLQEGAQENLREAEEQRRRQNETRRYLAAYLGTDEQVAGSGRFADVDPRVFDYTARYDIDAGLGGALVGGDFLQGKDSDPTFEDAGDSIVHGSGTADDKRRADKSQLRPFGIFSDAQNQANSLLQQAEDAARAGDFATADALKAQAERTLDDFVNAQGGIHAGEFREIFNLFEDPEARAAATAVNPQGRIVGSLIKNARELLDTESSTYKKFITDLTQGQIGEVEAQRVTGQRAIALGLQSNQAEIRRTQNVRGAGRSAGLEAARYERAQDRASAKSADIETLVGAEKGRIFGEASAFLEQYRRSFAQDVTRFAQGFIEGAPDVIENFAGAVERLNVGAGELAARFSNEIIQVHEQAPGQERSGVGGFIGTVIGAIIGSA